jgi:hypothetical protein
LLKISVKNRMLLAKLAVAKTVKKLLAVYGFRCFIAVLLWICHWNASKTRYTCSKYLRTKIHFVTVLPTTPMLLKMSFPFKIFHETRVYIFLLIIIFHSFRLFHFPWYIHGKNVHYYESLQYVIFSIRLLFPPSQVLIITPKTSIYV